MATGGGAGLLGAPERRAHDRAVGRRQAELVEQQLLPLRLDRGAQAAQLRAGGGVVAAEDLLPGGGAAHGVVADAVARHVHAHIRGRFVYAFVPCDAREDVAHDGEGLHVPVVVDGGDAVGLQMERVDHVHVREVGSGRLVGQVHRMLQRQIPDGERLKLGIAGGDARR